MNNAACVSHVNMLNVYSQLNLRLLWCYEWLGNMRIAAQVLAGCSSCTAAADYQFGLSRDIQTPHFCSCKIKILKPRCGVWLPSGAKSLGLPSKKPPSPASRKMPP